MTTEENIQKELALYENMNDEEVRKKYNVDFKEEARQYIIDYWIIMS